MALKLSEFDTPSSRAEQDLSDAVEIDPIGPGAPDLWRKEMFKIAVTVEVALSGPGQTESGMTFGIARSSRLAIFVRHCSKEMIFVL